MSRRGTNIAAALLGLIVLLLLAVGAMSQRLDHLLRENPAVAECLQAGGSAEECREAAREKP
ncbi:hypothetical protein [Deinococcus radiophilus]|uniref:Uncharacterized protein n=1 Tax=Deinococcus radiophilus TaxID=32062 RepID=A0A3S0KFI1_9DEIO|nr:hypothetical protein [Deinococcus radiophilus]RTR29377.1 hypothetical protein EJ104_03020 [Deinococcus radiophilus]UFA50796.1 hypothetical protein LMT64_02490 [Deinococcus radiophilus]